MGGQNTTRGEGVIGLYTVYTYCFNMRKLIYANYISPTLRRCRAAHDTHITGEIGDIIKQELYDETRSLYPRIH